MMKISYWPLEMERLKLVLLLSVVLVSCGKVSKELTIYIGTTLSTYIKNVHSQVILVQYTEGLLLVSVCRMSSLLSSRKSKTLDTEGDSFQNITRDVTAYFEKTENMLKDIKVEERIPSASYIFGSGNLADILSALPDSKFLGSGSAINAK